MIRKLIDAIRDGLTLLGVLIILSPHLIHAALVKLGFAKSR